MFYGCYSLTGTLTLEHSQLAVIDASLCTELAGLHLQCGALTDLNAAVCSALAEVRLCSQSMQRLDLSLLPLTQLEVDGSSLRELNLRGNNSLTSAGITLLAPSLTELDVRGTTVNAHALRLHSTCKYKQ